MGRDSQRGAAKLKAILWTVVLLYALFAAFKIVPVYFANYQLQDKMNVEARYSTVNRRSNEDLRKIIFLEIQDRGIPAKLEDITVPENGPRGVRISVEYTVPVDLLLYTWNMHFNAVADNRSVM